MQAKHNVLEYLEGSTCLWPDREAVVMGDESWTYGQLQNRCRKVGSALIEHSASGRPVVVLMDKSPSALAVMLGALYAGVYYVPVDPLVPDERLSALCKTLGNPLVVCDDATLSRAMHLQADIEVINANILFKHAVDAEGLRAVRARSRETDLAYVMFTSGSTGVPKGIAISHRCILSFIDSFAETFAFDASDRFANQAPFDFDVSVKDIYGALASGATLVLVPSALFSTPAALVDYLEDQRVTVLTWAVAALCLVTSFHALEGRMLPRVRHVLFSGEVMPAQPLGLWLDAAPHAQFVNVYGPTEITCNCMYHMIDRARDYTDGIPLGEPFAHCHVMLVDESGNVVRESDSLGEVVVWGPSLAQGYVGNEELTRCMFAPLENVRAGERAYRTGDMAAYSPTGDLFYRGRRDNQIKRQGHRIELEDVDLAIERIAGVNRCRCAYDRDRARLIAFYEGDVERAEVLRSARTTLPTHMLPNKIVRVEHFPLNKNGKVDRKELCR